MTLDTFTAAYIECALWSSNDESTESGGEPFDRNYYPEDIASECLAKMIADCAKFLTDNFDDINGDWEQAGHDFWLTRNGHGAGFWDGDWSTDAGERLTKASEAFGTTTLYLGDDDKIYAA